MIKVPNENPQSWIRSQAEMKCLLSVLFLNLLVVIFNCATGNDHRPTTDKENVKLLIVQYYQTKAFVIQKEYIVNSIDYNKLVYLFSDEAIKTITLVYMKGEQEEIDNKIRNLFLEPVGAADTILKFIKSAKYEDVLEVVFFFRDSFFEAIAQNV